MRLRTGQMKAPRTPTTHSHRPGGVILAAGVVLGMGLSACTHLSSPTSRHPNAAPSRHPGTSTPLPAVSPVQAAKAVLSQVTDTVESYGWNRTPAGQVAQVRSLLTPSLAAELASAHVPPAQEVQWQAEHFQADASVRGIQVRSFNGTQLDATILYELSDHPQAQGPADGLLSAVAVRLGNQWLVAELQPYAASAGAAG